MPVLLPRLLKWGINLKQLVVLQLFVGVFMPWERLEHMSVAGLLLTLVVALIKLLAGVWVIALFENSMTRLRFFATSQVTWFGFDSGFMQFFRVRESSMKMAEILAGARKTYGLNLIGGIRRDLLKDDMSKSRQLAQQMLREVQELVEILLTTPNY